MVAFLSLACAPMPFLFYKYGARLRKHSKYAPSSPLPDEDECSDKEPQPNENEALEPEYAADAGEHTHESSYSRPSSKREGRRGGGEVGEKDQDVCIEHSEKEAGDIV